MFGDIRKQALKAKKPTPYRQLEAGGRLEDEAERVDDEGWDAVSVCQYSFAYGSMLTSQHSSSGMIDSDKQNIKLAAGVVAAADAVLITAGAGIGVDSGLPDFRGNKGFWKAYPMAEKLGLSFSELANPIWFERNPRIAWGFYGHRLNLYRSTVPHGGFQQLLGVCEEKPRGYFVFTSNVDGQFQKAGFSKDTIVECHGSIHYLQCTGPCSDVIWPAKFKNIVVNEETCSAEGDLPTCPLCGGYVRPNILMFNDGNWIGGRTDKQEWNYYHWWHNLIVENCSVAIIELGAGKAVPTVRRKSESLAARHKNVRLIRINPRDHDVPAGQISVPLGAGDGLKEIIWAL